MPVGEKDIVLFAGGKAGYGYARDTGEDGYGWAVGFDCRSGRAVPTAAYTRVVSSIGFSKIACLFEWESSTGRPMLLWTGGNGTGNAIIYEWANGNLAANSRGSQVAFTSGVLYKYDHTSPLDADAEVAYFCNGFDNQVLNRRRKNGDYDTGGATANTAKADLLMVGGADLYRSIGYKVGKLTPSTDPGIETNWPTEGASVAAGRPSYAINAGVSLGGSIVVFKGDGVCKYNPAPSAATFDYVLPATPHPDNGRAGTTDGRGRWYYPTIDGHLVVGTFGYQDSQTPTRNTFADRNTPYGRISAITTDLDHVWIALEPGFVRTQDGVGLVVKKQVGATVTTDTDAVTDRIYNTTADWSTLVSGDYIWVGSTGVDAQPFCGVYIELDTARATTTAASALTASYGSSPGTYTACTVIDSTMCFAQDGLITFHVNRQHPYDTATPWVQTTVDGVVGYWLRIEVTSTVLTNVRAREVYVLPYRPPIDPDGNNTTSVTSITGYVQAGALPAILSGTWVKEKLVYQHVATLWTGKIEQMVTARVNDAITDSRRALYLVSCDGLYAMPIGPDGDPVRAAYPNLGNADTFAAGIGDHGIKLSANDAGMPANTKRVTGKLVIRGENLQSDDELWAYYRWDNSDRWERSGPHTSFPIAIDIEGEGKLLEGYLAFKDGSRTAIAPYIDSAVIPAGQWEWDAEQYTQPLWTNVSSPQTL